MHSSPKACRSLRDAFERGRLSPAVDAVYTVRDFIHKGIRYFGERSPKDRRMEKASYEVSGRRSRS